MVPSCSIASLEKADTHSHIGWEPCKVIRLGKMKLRRALTSFTEVAIGGAMALIGLLYLFSTFQTHVNILEPGLMDFQFGYNEFSKAIAKAYTAEDVVQKKKAPEPDQAAIQAEIDRQRGVYLTKTLAACEDKLVKQRRSMLTLQFSLSDVPINPIAAGNGYVRLHFLRV